MTTGEKIQFFTLIGTLLTGGIIAVLVKWKDIPKRPKVAAICILLLFLCGLIVWGAFNFDIRPTSVQEQLPSPNIVDEVEWTPSITDTPTPTPTPTLAPTPTPTPTPTTKPTLSSTPVFTEPPTNTHLLDSVAVNTETSISSEAALSLNFPYQFIDKGVEERARIVLGKKEKEKITLSEWRSIESMPGSDTDDSITITYGELFDKDCSPIYSLDDFRYCDSLYFLSISQVQHADFLPLIDLSLTSLDVFDSAVDISAFAKIKTIDILSLVNCGITDVSPLAALSNLQYLDLKYNQIVDTSPLRVLEKNGTTINLYGNPTTEVLERAPIGVPTPTAITPMVYTFVDAGVEKLARYSLNKKEGEYITVDEWGEVTALPPKVDNYAFYGPPIFSLEDFRECTSIEELYLENLHTSNFSPLKELANLDALGIYRSTITELSSIAELRRLNDLTIVDTQLTDISELAKMTNLLFLELVNCDIKNVSFLSSLTNLVFVDLRDNSINDTSPLYPLRKAGAAVFLDGNPTNVVLEPLLTDMHSPASMPTPTPTPRPTDTPTPRRRQVEIGGRKVWSDESILKLSGSNINDVTPLQSLTNLRELDISDNQINDISSFRSLNSLAKLQIRDNQIRDISPLQSLSKLTELDLANNRIRDINPLQSLTKLTDLCLFGNEIRDLSSLQSLTNLTVLYLGANPINNASLKPLQSLTNLTELSIAYTSINDTDPMQSLTNLTKLWLYDNKIRDISPLQSMTNLQALGLGNNRIKEIAPLKSLKNLKELDLSGNPLTQEQIDDLRKALPNCKIEF